jgi:hypothetical protein
MYQQERKAGSHIVVFQDRFVHATIDSQIRGRSSGSSVIVQMHLEGQQGRLVLWKPSCSVPSP